ncbi:MAG: recombinase RecA [Lentisphaeria bacterium]|nr:recombinase RecA [Lentisphaeria bacterium]
MAEKKGTASASASSVADARAKNLGIALGQIEKEYGKGAIMRLGDNTTVDVPVISTGALSLDIALGIMGLPRGRIIEIFGPESSGKTTLCMHVIANAQKAGGVAAFIDAEHAVDPQYAKRIGVNIDNLLIAQPDCGEDALNIVNTLITSNAVDIIVIDSVAALVPKAEFDGQVGDSFMGLQARMMSQALRKITGAVSRSRTCCIFTNQIREKIGVMFGNPETTTGGNAMKFYSSIRMDIRKIQTIKDSSGEAIGARAKVKVVKNKLAPPFKTAEFDIMWNEGISRIGSIIDVGMDLGLLEKRGSWFSFENEQLAQGREAVKAYLQENHDVEERILNKIKAVLAERKAAASGGNTASAAPAAAAQASAPEAVPENPAADSAAPKA